MATEEPIIADVEVTVEPVAVDQVNEEEKVEVMTKAKKTTTKKKAAAKEPKAKKVAAPRKAKTPSAHPPYFEMISEAITSLKEKTGSSQYAIAKFIEENHKNVPANFKKLLLFHLKKLVASNKLSKIKNSYKLPSTKPPSSPTKKPTTKPKPIAKKAPVTKPKSKPLARKAKPAPKAVSKPKAKVVVKAKVATPVKAKAAAPRPKPKERAVKAARTSTRMTPGRKAPVARVAPPPKTAAKKKTPVKKAATRRGKK